MEHRNNSERDLFYTIATLQTKEECHTFLSEILSPHEFSAVVNRWRMMILLHERRTQREISEQLGVGVATVSRANKLLRKRNSFCMKKLIELIVI